VKRVAALFLFVLMAAGTATARHWQSAAIIGVSETTVTSPMMRRAKIIVHYTVVTGEFTLTLDYTYHPPTKSDEPDQPGKNSPPSVALGGATKISLEGHHAYLLDVSGKEVKMDVKKKIKNQ
jgi:hypothetical protein